MLRRRAAIGLPTGPDEQVFVDDHGVPVPPEEIPLRLRFATSVRISIEGNAHFCRGLLATRYADGPDAGSRGRPGDEDHEHEERVMKAVQVVGYHTKLQLTDVAEPEIRTPYDVIVRIGGAGVCRTDLHILEGQWEAKSNVTLPYTIGHENAGWVHAVGDAVTNVAVGDKVIVHPLDHLRAVPRVPLRRRRALREQPVPGHRHRRRVRRAAAHQRAQRGPHRRLPGARRRGGARGRRAHGVPRGREGGAGPAPR